MAENRVLGGLHLSNLRGQSPRYDDKTKKTAISRIENHAEDIKLSTLERVAAVLGKRLQVSIA